VASPLCAGVARGAPHPPAPAPVWRGAGQDWCQVL